ncbi:hypothetical protein AB0G79_10710 [Streptomyces sp. NPDC020807]|uniref:hypothetical protein n=1 Tax=Streptomyces sp. NPDC020807 TaxID=3155119 RepID=UPI0033D44B18
MRAITTGLLLGALCLGLTGCAGVGERTGAARRAAVAFEQAVSASDARRACAALAPGTREELEGDGPCPVVLAGLDLPADAGAPLRAEVFGDQARVEFEDDLVFLASFPDGWKVTAAGCTPRPERPADCEVEGS